MKIPFWRELRQTIQDQFPEGMFVGMDNALQNSGSGDTQIPLGGTDTYEPEKMSSAQYSAIKSMQDGVGDLQQPFDTPPRQPSAIEEPIQPMLMERGEVAPISPVFGKQSLAQMQLEKDEREKMAQVLRGY
jgi:hypothetical protein|tara:strand:- start:369 stop:761 length:393 start_codon:yes stop_codon:yes gene_type:complete